MIPPIFAEKLFKYTHVILWTLMRFNMFLFYRVQIISPKFVTLMKTLYIHIIEIVVNLGFFYLLSYGLSNALKVYPATE